MVLCREMTNAIKWVKAISLFNMIDDWNDHQDTNCGN